MKLCGVSRACAPSPSGLCPKLQVVSQTDFTSTCVCVCVCVAGRGGGISMTVVVAPASQALRWQHGGGVSQHMAPPVPAVPVSALYPVLCCGTEVRSPLSTRWGWWFPDPPPRIPKSVDAQVALSDPRVLRFGGCRCRGPAIPCHSLLLFPR